MRLKKIAGFDIGLTEIGFIKIGNREVRISDAGRIKINPLHVG
tara:strand:+ start:186 stop:314 length:129 start_codon:yes stop_codon:yes gene_type:complete